MSTHLQASDTPETFFQTGLTLFQKGQRADAYSFFARAVVGAPDHHPYKVTFIQALAGQSLNQFEEHLKQAILICLKTDTLRHTPLFFAWYSMLIHGDHNHIVKNALGGDETYLHDVIRNLDLEPVLNAPFFCLGLEKLLIKNYPLEKLLTRLRLYFCLHTKKSERETYLPFLKSLAIQCFFNEYVFYQTENEEAEILKFEKSLELLPTQALILGCYKPLHMYDENSDLGLKLENIGAKAVRIFQIDEPRAEYENKSTIKSFAPIQNKISNVVKLQYEDHPFPRWRDFGAAAIPPEQQQQSAGKKILIAGCGTGQQAMMVAHRYPLADITAIDLSIASLAYAKRKATERSIQNIEFSHGDILNVGQLRQTYDYIACGGVLHHMEEPDAGLRALKSVLKENGVMRIALYSEIARRNIVRIQNWIKEQNLASHDDDIRDFRKLFFETLRTEFFGNPPPYFELFSISEVRDLFFHVQEHRFTCPQLKLLFQDTGMSLISFAPGMPVVLQKYALMFPDDLHSVDLDNWHIFEQQFPNVFIGMYKFYISHDGEYEAGSLPQWLR